MACRLVLCSISFSVPRCNSPMCGSTRSTTSPSSSSTRRSTPCAAGCCGPKLIVKLRVGTSFMRARYSYACCFPYSPLATRHSLCAAGHSPFADLLGFRRDPRLELVPLHDKAFVAPFADEVGPVVRFDPESDAWPDDFHALDIDCYGHSDRGRREVAHIDVHADAAFAGIEMGGQKLHAGPFHQRDHEAGGEDVRHGCDFWRLGVGVRRGLARGHLIGETVGKPGLERRLHLTTPARRRRPCQFPPAFPSAAPFHRPAARNRFPPRARGNRSCGIPGQAAPAKTPRA